MSKPTEPSALADLFAYLRTLRPPLGKADFDPKIRHGQISAVISTLAACYMPPMAKHAQDRAVETTKMEPPVNAEIQKQAPSSLDENEKPQMVQDLKKS